MAAEREPGPVRGQKAVSSMLACFWAAARCGRQGPANARKRVGETGPAPVQPAIPSILARDFARPPPPIARRPSIICQCALSPSRPGRAPAARSPERRAGGI